ncbi:DUF2490 domain-containing protein [Flavobacteriaceae bacterium TK19130]|nr:DUF2490 domain-containing protein [Thermobacterium salinum]
MDSYFSKNFFGLIVVVFIPLLSFAQGTAVLWEPEAELDLDISNRWSMNFGTDYRVGLSEQLGEAGIQYVPIHLSFSQNTTYEIGFYGKVSAGIMYRFNTIGPVDESNELRTIQQYSYGKQYNSIRLVHRVRSEQRIKSTGTAHRFRYRLSIDLPLNGEQLNAKEFYFAASVESLLTVASRDTPEWDQRITAGLGRELTSKTRLQVDVQYRFDDYFNAGGQRLFFTTGIQYSL